MAIKIGAVQHQIMRVLWDEGEATAKRITEKLSEQKEVALSTVQTLLRKLETKGAVEHFKRERAFYFKAKVGEEEVSRSAVEDLLGRVFQGSVSGLVAHLLETEDVSTGELKRLRQMVDDKMKEHGK